VKKDDSDEGGNNDDSVDDDGDGYIGDQIRASTVHHTTVSEGCF
jgi:hypothetical protein